MVNIPLGLGDWESPTQDMSRLKLRNMYVIPNPASPDNASRVSRPTLKTSYVVGAGPITSMWSQPNILSGDTLVVSGQELYRVPANLFPVLIGPLPGVGKAEISGAQFIGLPDVILIARDGVLYHTNGTTITTISIPDGQLVASVDTLNGYFIFSIVNSQKFYWLEPGSLKAITRAKKGESEIRTHGTG